MQIGCKVFDAVLYSLSVKTAELNVQLVQRDAADVTLCYSETKVLLYIVCVTVSDTLLVLVTPLRSLVSSFSSECTGCRQ